MANLDELMKELNPAQLQAVRHPPQIPLQILAGPGSGKTKVLTMRIAYLISRCYLPANTICAVTFTNKAANEMRERLIRLLGKDTTMQIKMGTFHALCAAFLRRYARRVGLEGNFTVCDADESKKIIRKLMKLHEEEIKESEFSMKEGAVQSIISNLKAKAISPEGARAQLQEMDSMTQAQWQERILTGQKFDLPYSGQVGAILVKLYKEYNENLRAVNSLDFDDLLLFGVELFKTHKKASSFCKHILVDEYQDTNTLQYQLMSYIAQTCRCVSIVGDPDQSIYGWRAAEIANLAHMQRDFPSTQQILLEHNYRSTASILEISMAVISQDNDRIKKTLVTSHAKGSLPVLRAFPTEHTEAGFIAAEIKRLVAFTGGLLDWSDFVVLLRYNAMSRVIESALQKQGIPNRVLAGHKFFERMEVKDILAYLQLVDNPAFLPAFNRVVNVPPRGVGDKTVAVLLHQAEQLNTTPLDVVQRIIDGKIPDIKPPVKRKLGEFIGIIRDLRTYANQGMAPSKLIQALLDFIKYKDHLRKTQPEWESRWENVEELINFATEVQNSMVGATARMMADAEEDAHEELHGGGPYPLGDAHAPNRPQLPNVTPGYVKCAPICLLPHAISSETPLRLFLQASMLSTDTEGSDDEESRNKVTIGTCHAAKGLEWAVVFIPAVEGGVFPAARAEDDMEELRLLYVACTRAQSVLYITHAQTRMHAGVTMESSLSPFITQIRGEPKTAGLLSGNLPALPSEDRATMAKILNRTPPEEAEVTQRVAELYVSCERRSLLIVISMQRAAQHTPRLGPERSLP
ncbi:UvrD-helicase-domain-containing protein [Epithele typhae]|uniref:UvrD-helicase-domain-containing protein n=1 Tax=Epithele typhae TaxID=378194 RepID=UPI002008578E|nr:UvrD-helicase-domain-containing protein [Epithele typhae]KAH9945389.1 UvrD-helicase-domain-containing protein [Epithele typhae]